MLVQLLRKCAEQTVPMRRLPHSPASSLMVISPSALSQSLRCDKCASPCLQGVSFPHALKDFPTGNVTPFSDVRLTPTCTVTSCHLLS